MCSYGNVCPSNDDSDDDDDDDDDDDLNASN